MNILDALLVSVSSSLFIYGVIAITSEGMLLHFIRRFLDRHLIKPDGTARKIYYPILFCPVCMSGLYTIIFVLLAFKIDLFIIPYLLICPVITAGIISFLND